MFNPVVDVVPVGLDSGVLRGLATEAVRRLETLDGVQDVSPDYKRGRDEIQVTIDREKASRVGLTAQDLSNTFGFTLGGMRLNRLNAGDREVETWLSLRIEDRRNLEDLKQVQFAVQVSASRKFTGHRRSRTSGACRVEECRWDQRSAVTGELKHIFAGIGPRRWEPCHKGSIQSLARAYSTANRAGCVFWVRSSSRAACFTSPRPI